MAKQPGRLMLVKIGDGAGSETFANLCGLRTKTFTLNNASFDVTTPDCTTPGGQLWREVMTGIRSLSVSGSGLFTDSASEARALAVAHGTGVADTADAICNFQLIVPSFYTFAGAFHIDSLEYSGQMEGEGVAYTIALSSTGVITKTVVA